MSDHDAPAADPDATPADPEELDFTDDESVVEIGKGRYVVGTNGRPNVKPAQPPDEPADETGFTAADPTSPAERQPPDANSQADTAGAGGAPPGQATSGGGNRGQPPGGGRQPGDTQPTGGSAPV